MGYPPLPLGRTTVSWERARLVGQALYHDKDEYQCANQKRALDLAIHVQKAAMTHCTRVVAELVVGRRHCPEAEETRTTVTDHWAEVPTMQRRLLWHLVPGFLRPLLPARWLHEPGDPAKVRFPAVTVHRTTRPWLIDPFIFAEVPRGAMHASRAVVQNDLLGDIATAYSATYHEDRLRAMEQAAEYGRYTP